MKMLKVWLEVIFLWNVVSFATLLWLSKSFDHTFKTDGQCSLIKYRKQSVHRISTPGDLVNVFITFLKVLILFFWHYLQQCLCQ